MYRRRSYVKGQINRAHGEHECNVVENVPVQSKWSQHLLGDNVTLNGGEMFAI